ncbi:MAG: hypothetical protein WC600_06750 [Desulfobaccales bacterium]
MATDSKLFVEIANGRLRLAPRGTLTDGVVRQILGAAQIGFRAFSVLVVDLQEAGEVDEDTLASLEAGLRKLIAAKKHALLAEPGKWILQTAETSKDACQCNGNCRDCACRSHADQTAKKQVNTG